MRLLSAPQARSLPCRIAILGLFLAAWRILLHRLNNVPAGFRDDPDVWHHERHWSALGAPHRLFFPGTFGREPLGTYGGAGALRATGEHSAWRLCFFSAFWAMLGLVTLSLMSGLMS